MLSACRIRRKTADQLLKISFLVSLAAVVGSLFFSEVLNFSPCVLCWYQRICLYPLVFVFGTGILRDEMKSVIYAMPLIVAGLCVAVYHCLLMYGVIPESIAPCKAGVSCTAKQIEYLGFVTIPLLSLLTFLSLLIVAIVIYRSGVSDEK